jgi:S-adenosylmethionine decarboxylase
MVVASEPFGYMLTLDLYRCKPSACVDLALCYRFLDDLVDTLHMHRQAPPFIFRHDARAGPERAGISGWVPLIESGIQIHTLVRPRFVSVDIYSCGRFDPEGVREFVRPYFEPEDVETNFILRGTKYHLPRPRPAE